jgi:hypothetical protein
MFNKEILNRVQNDNYGDLADCQPCKSVDHEEILNRVQNDSYADRAACHPRKLDDMKKLFDREQSDNKAVVELEEQSVETLTRISNFRGAQIEILPSAKGSQSHKTRKLVCSASVTKREGYLRD